MKNKRAKSKSGDITVPVGAIKNVSPIKGGSTKFKADKAGVEKTNKVRSGAIAQNMLPEDYRPSSLICSSTAPRQIHAVSPSQ